MTNKEFQKNFVWEKDLVKEWQILKVWITTVDQSDFKEKRDWDFWEELIYKFKLQLPNWDTKDAELIINENQKALWKLVIDWNEYTIWKFVNEDGVSNSFKYDDRWRKVDRRQNKKWETYYVIKIWEKFDKEDLEDFTDEVEF